MSKLLIGIYSFYDNIQLSDMSSSINEEYLAGLNGWCSIVKIKPQNDKK